MPKKMTYAQLQQLGDLYRYHLRGKSCPASPRNPTLMVLERLGYAERKLDGEIYGATWSITDAGLAEHQVTCISQECHNWFPANLAACPKCGSKPREY